MIVRRCCAEVKRAGPLNLAAPEAIQCRLDLDEPDDAAYEWKEDPEACEAAHRAGATALRVHPPGVRREQEMRDADQGKQDSTDAADALTALVVHFLEVHVEPVQAVDPERDDGQDERERDAARAPRLPSA